MARATAPESSTTEPRLPLTGHWAIFHSNDHSILEFKREISVNDHASRDSGSASGSPTPTGSSRHHSTRRPRYEPPVLVITPKAEAEAPASRDGGTKRRRTPDTVTRNLSAMVEDLLKKVREGEEKLKEKEAAVVSLQEQTVAMAQRLLESGRGAAAEGCESDEAAQDRLSITALDFFGLSAPHRDNSGDTTGPIPVPPHHPAPVQRPSRSASVGAGSNASHGHKAGRSSAGVHVCPACAQKLRKAKCGKALALVCLNCHGLFLEIRALQELKDPAIWRRFVDQFLGTAVRADQPKSSQTASGGRRSAPGSSRVGLKDSAR